MVAEPCFPLLENAVDDLSCQIESFTALFEAGDDPDAVRSVMKAGFADFVENLFTAVPERCVTQIMPKGDGSVGLRSGRDSVKGIWQCRPLQGYG